MLRASSLGSISVLTTHHFLRIWSQPTSLYHLSTFGIQLDGTFIRASSTLRNLKRGHNDTEGQKRAIHSQEPKPPVKDHHPDTEPFVARDWNTLGQTFDSTNPSTDNQVNQQDHSDSEDLCVTKKPPYPTGRSRHVHPVNPLYGGKYWHGDCFAMRGAADRMLFPPKSVFYINPDVKDVDTSKRLRRDEELYFRHCHVIANTQSASEAWTSYSIILTLPIPRTHRRDDPNIPFAHLHRLCRLLARNRPKTRNQFLRLLSVLYYIRKFGGKIHSFEWNALISHAGSGREFGTTGLKLALDVFEDMVSGEPPGTTFSPSEFPPLHQPKQPARPDIFTYNTLIGIAAKSLYGHAVQRTTSMMQNSGEPPDRITHLSLLPFFTGSKQLSGVRTTLLNIRQQNLELGLDGINACIWAYGFSGRTEIVSAIYQVMRQNLQRDLSETQVADLERLLDNEGISFSAPMKPNEVTFTALVQIMAYYGDLSASLRILMDMLSSDDLELGAPMTREESGEVKHTTYAPTTAVFRALFLGFARHGTTEVIAESKTVKAWSLVNLQHVYKLYMTLPEPLIPNRWVIYWIMNAFDKTSDHDVELMRKVWIEMEERFDGPWGGAANRLRELKKILFSDEAERYLQKHGFCIERRTPRASNYSAPWLS